MKKTKPVGKHHHHHNHKVHHLKNIEPAVMEQRASRDLKEQDGGKVGRSSGTNPPIWIETQGYGDEGIVHKDGGYEGDSNVPKDGGYGEYSNVPKDGGYGEDSNVPKDGGYGDVNKVPKDGGYGAQGNGDDYRAKNVTVPAWQRWAVNGLALLGLG